MEFICKPCNLKYKTQSGLWKHNGKNHTITNKPSVTITISKLNKKSSFNCIHCVKQFSSKQSKWRHEQKCQVKNTFDKRISQLESIINNHKIDIPNIFDKQINIIKTTWNIVKTNYFNKTIMSIHKQLQDIIFNSIHTYKNIATEFDYVTNSVVKSNIQIMNKIIIFDKITND
jgi:hypothetical protein